MFDWKKHSLQLLEPFRLATEYGQLWLEWPLVRDLAPPGDGHPVLVLPGFTAHDILTRPLREALKQKGYKTYGWEHGFNIGVREETAAYTADLLKKIYTENGGQKVSIVGHSLGGIYARELAKEFPEIVRDVITIGTPFGIGIDQAATPAAVITAINLMSDKRFSLNNEGMGDRLLTPPPVPTSSIFSKTDIIAGWKACLNPATRQAENIEVTSSHLGGTWNVNVIRIVLDRLAQQPGEWKPYKNRSQEPPPKNPKWRAKKGSTNFFRK